MSKKHFIALADMIRTYNNSLLETPFDRDQITALAGFCKSTNPRFNRERWLAYIAGECGPNGGQVKAKKQAA